MRQMAQNLILSLYSDCSDASAGQRALDDGSGVQRTVGCSAGLHRREELSQGTAGGAGERMMISAANRPGQILKGRKLIAGRSIREVGRQLIELRGRGGIATRLGRLRSGLQVSGDLLC